MNERNPHFLFYTLGCKVNQYESQALTEQLEKCGFVRAESGEPCDFVFLNTCAVTAESVRKAKQLTRRAQKKHPNAFILVAGCATQLEPQNFSDLFGVDYICGTRNKNGIVQRAVSLWNQKQKAAAAECCIVPPCGDIEQMSITRFDRARAYVKIQDGCNGKCTYCIIPSLRGTVCSRQPKDILSEVDQLVKNGCTEIVLTGIETSAYEYDLAELLKQLNATEGLQRIRMGSLDPSFMKPSFVDRICFLEKVAPHFHLSIQSGSDSVLMRMKRRYLMKTVYENVSYIRQKMPRVQFSADVIVGFPGETPDEFVQTCHALERLRLLHVHVFPYSARPGTEAAALPEQISESTKNERVLQLSTLSEKIRNDILERIVAEKKTIEVLIETVEENGVYVGHSGEFIEVKFASRHPQRRGAIASVLPIRHENGILIGDAIDAKQ